MPSKLLTAMLSETLRQVRRASASLPMMSADACKPKDGKARYSPANRPSIINSPMMETAHAAVRR